MEFIIGAVILLLALITYGLMLRKKIHNEVDNVEAWKIEIMNRPVTDEILKVKELNLSGQAEAKFEEWRTIWDEIITIRLPEVEEKLFDAEDAADRYQIKKARAIIYEMKQELQEVENKIEAITNDLKDIVEQGQNSKIEIDDLRHMYQEAKKFLLTDRFRFGKAIGRLEIKLDDIEQKFKSFEKETEEGNYSAAGEIVEEISKLLQELQEVMTHLPRLLKICAQEIPAEIKDLRVGIQEMTEEGYVLEHLNILERIAKIEEESDKYLVKLQKGEIDKVLGGVKELKDSLEEIYGQLETEVQSRQKLTNEVPKIKANLIELQEEIAITKEETKYIEQRYHTNEEDLQIQQELELAINKIIKKHQDIVGRLEEGKLPSSKIFEELEAFKEQILKLKVDHDLFCEMLQNLRKDEVFAKDKITEMKRTLFEAKRIVGKSNLPGLPDHYVNEFELAEESIISVLEKIDEMPLDIPAIMQLLDEAVQYVERVNEKTHDMIEKALMTEQVIQYGNRYRTSYPILSAKLLEAEQLFRNYDYDTALTQAITAVEEIEPNALEKINNLLQAQ